MGAPSFALFAKGGTRWARGQHSLKITKKRPGQKPAASSQKHTMSDLAHNLIHRFNVGDALRRSAGRAPRQRAILFQGRELTYTELDALANRLARMLMANGIGH